ncbi:MAG TPA: VIT1/CCC1 transporter family protein, partial [Gemmatimonadales bacterium]|nr:VIT1/CCC1 transporter family protein [Gemmatimonadales bacterium]
RLRAWVGRRFGPRLLLPLLLREEGREVKGYLDLYRGSPDGAAAPTALRLARESKEHADRLATLTGAAAEPWHRRHAGGFLRNVVYGFNDGLTANFGLVAGMIGAQATFGEAGHAVLVAGIAGMVADALSMGSSGYLAAKSEREVHEHEIAMERDEIRLLPELEREELRLIYQAKGLPEAQASALAERVMADPERALEEKTREELGIAGEPGSPLREGWITGTATALGALIPVAPFLAGTGRWAIWSSFAISMLSHFAVGAARSVFTGRGVFRSGIDMFVVGLGVAAVGYVIGEWMVRWL